MSTYCAEVLFGHRTVTMLMTQCGWQSVEASFRQSVHLVKEFEPLLFEISQLSNEFAAGVRVGCSHQIANYCSRVFTERVVSLQEAVKRFFVSAVCHVQTPPPGRHSTIHGQWQDA
jgi:hypothetical protein